MGPPFPWALRGHEGLGAAGQSGTQVWGMAWREGWDAGGTSGSGGAGSPLGSLGVPGAAALPDVAQLSAALPPTPHPPGSPPRPHTTPMPPFFSCQATFWGPCPAAGGTQLTPWLGREREVGGGAFCTFYCFFFSWKTKQNPNASIPHYASILHSAFSIIAPSPLAGQCHQTPGYSSPRPWGRCPGPPTLMRIQIGSRGLEQLREQGVCRQQMVLDGPQGEVSGMGHSPGQSRGNEAEEQRSGFPAIVPMGCCRDGHDALHCEVLGMQCSHGSTFHPSGAHCPMAVHGANGEQSPAGVQGLWNEGP